MPNKLTRIAQEVLFMESDLPQRFDYSSGEKPKINDFEIHLFEQTWGSTALGFSGIGGQAITTANTYVFVPISCNQKCFVYFAGEFAYAAPYCDVLREDILHGKMEPVSRKGKYFTQNKEMKG